MSETLSIVAVGGGSPIGSRALLEHALELSGVDHAPRVLIVPTPCVTPEKYNRRLGGALKLYKDALGLPVDILHDFGEMPSHGELTDKFGSADVVYTTGGDTAHTVQEFNKHGISDIVKARAAGGLVLSGISTGSALPFAWAHCDPIPTRKANFGEYISVSALGMVHAGVTPHFDRTQPDGGKRSDDFMAMLPLESRRRGLNYAFGIDNKASLIIHDGLITWQGTGEGGVTVAYIGDHIEAYHRMTTGDSMRLDEL